ncbi:MULTISPECIES: MarR family winged helix-turn-helix transcriptional regulator [unclassified Amycolatopsis]|uniref:MarR family winged helix-turn-helix transcriptional regulator n=1 Tax=unclassified Amycolatopsis TaxID=2618356 RepID=UPI002E0DF08B|nr:MULTISPECIES: MarR family transcriptional regulator [unclassified Amycolatopsis]WSJ80180.1 MarR family transcriptional regulator [Amycolatopsis sp. NBC_01307]WSK76338.1 MarR family transcriptional regulator [Amycolatopsis sp. NBC_01286]
MTVSTAPEPDLSTWPTGRLLAVAARLVEQRWVAVLAGMGLTHAGLIALHTLREGPLPQRALAQRCQVTDQTMSRTLDRLAKAGFVTRTPDPADARRHLTRLTARGRTVHERAVRAEREDPALLGGLGDDDAFRARLLSLIGGLSAGD